MTVLALAACQSGEGRFSADISNPVFRAHLAGPAHAESCRSRGILLIEGSQGDDALALVWYFGDSLHADSVPLGPPIWRRPGATDSIRSAASGAYRRTTPNDVLGYQSRIGWLRVSPARDGAIAATFAAVFDRTGMAESVAVRGGFDHVRVTEDSTLCAVPRTTSDSGVTLRP